MGEKVVIGDAELYHMDCMDLLPTLGRSDLGLTDPPFGVGNFVQTTGRIRGRGSNTGSVVSWNDATPDKAFFDVFMKKTSDRIIWGANFFNCFEAKGGTIIWDKAQSMPNFSKADIASCTHYQKTEIVRIPWTNFTVTHEAASDHPCERPVRLYEWCIEYLPNKINSVLDPFMGSGTTGVACANLGKSFVGIERERKYFDIACERIDAAYAQGRLFA